MNLDGVSVSGTDWRRAEFEDMRPAEVAEPMDLLVELAKRERPRPAPTSCGIRASRSVPQRWPFVGSLRWVQALSGQYPGNCQPYVLTRPDDRSRDPDVSPAPGLAITQKWLPAFRL